MQKKSDKISMEQAAQLASSPAGQALYSLLRQQQGAKLDKAIAQANAGDYTALQQTVSALMASEDAQALIKKLGG